MESHSPSSPSSSAAAAPSAPVPTLSPAPASVSRRCTKRKYGAGWSRSYGAGGAAEEGDSVAALRGALEEASVGLLLTHLRRVASRLRPPSTCASPARTLCDAGLLQLLPSLLSHSSSKVVKRSVEVVGLLAVSSYEVSCRLAEKASVAALAQALKRSEAGVVLAAVHAILNVATTAPGCAVLREAPGLQQQLMRQVFFLADALNGKLQTSLGPKTYTDANVGGREMPKDDGLDFLLQLPPDEMAELFDSALAAVNTIFHGVALDDCFSRPVLQSLWRNVVQLQPRFEGDTHEVAECLRRPNRRNQLAKLVMKLAMQRSVDVNTVDARRIFMKDERFFQKYWELSPARTMTACESLGLSIFLKRIAGSSPTRMLELLVDGMVACPPAVADELDPLVLYEDMEQELGLLPVYNQDIRLLQCKAGSEILYRLESETPSVSSRDCVNAYTSGNTVVIRGLQFRWPEISVISSALAVELGQVTVGANLYLTPPGAQGLGVHFDDHCVFVCQLRGHKRWDVYPPFEQLPRLYSFKTLSTDLINKDRATHYDLQEGDVLYIPRGFPHEARTVENVKAPSEGFLERTSFADQSALSEWHGASLHLSFGVEVEPAFEWEGLLHIALRLWFHRSLQERTPGVTTSSCSMDDIYEILLHVAIRNVGNNSHLFRKACRPSCWKQNSIDPDHMFRLTLGQVRESADFLSALENYQTKGFAWLDWLRHLSVGHCNPGGCDLESSNEVEESTFQNILHRFSHEASFLESVEAQDVLLCNFRKSRQKVTNGLLALHCGWT